MKNLSTTVAVYADIGAAETDWTALEAAAADNRVDLADAALVTRDGEGATTVERHSHHGWGKGAVAGAIVGILFPPALLSSTLVGAAGGGVVARLNRSLDRGDIKDLGEVLVSGTIALVVLTSQDTAEAASRLLVGAKSSLTKESTASDEVVKELTASS
jgi:uncharacterized membrane protein